MAVVTLVARSHQMREVAILPHTRSDVYAAQQGLHYLVSYKELNRYTNLTAHQAYLYCAKLRLQGAYVPPALFTYLRQRMHEDAPWR